METARRSSLQEDKLVLLYAREIPILLFIRKLSTISVIIVKFTGWYCNTIKDSITVLSL